jgi:UDP-N-acetyl-D-glucosamine dehydrogenase
MVDLSARIADRSAVVAVIGLGYVGLPLAAAFHAAGFRVLGFDIDPAKIDALGRGETYLMHVGATLAADLNATGRFGASADFARLGEADAIAICVPTPLGPHFEPDLSFVEQTARDIAKTLRRGQLVVLESTTYPGTTRDVVRPILEGAGLVCGRDIFLAFSPEREDPGRTSHTTRTIPKLVGGVDETSGRLAVELYRTAVAEVVPVSSAEVAEAAKLLENIYRSVNIALVNEMKLVMHAMGIDVWEVIAAASTKPFGFQAFYPGPGLGGHCIPIDPFYLTWKAREVGVRTRFIELAGEVNRAMPGFVVDQVTLALNARSRAVRGSRILVLGLAYKKDVDDTRESPSVELIEMLAALGAHVDYNDPHCPRTHPMRRADLKRESVPLTPQHLASYDAVVIATDHSAYDWAMIAGNSRLIIDTRNALGHIAGPRDHIVKA